MKISDNKYVTLTYDLNVGEGDDYELMEQATVEEPLEFVFGTNSMIKAFEDNIYGLSKGDTFNFTINPEDAYGNFEEDKIVDLPKSIFEVDGKINNEMLFEGNMLPMMNSDGNRLNGSIVSITDDTVIMDFNHPLAGETMHFVGVVQDVRDTSPEEIAALFSGGCGCGCDSCGNDDSLCGCGSGGCGNGCSC